MAVDAHLSSTVPAGGIIADEVAVVVFGCLDANRMFQLGHDGQGGEDASAIGGGADDTLGRDIRNACYQPFEDERAAAMSTGQRQSRAISEANGVRDLTFQRGDVRFPGLIGRGSDAVFLRIEAETFGEVDGVRAGHGRTETLDGGEYLLVEVPFCVWLQG